LIHAFLAVSAIVPSVLLMAYFHRRDLYREPARDLWLAFAAGVLVALPVLAFATPLTPIVSRFESPLLYGLVAAFLQAGIPEELFKFLMLWFVVARRASFDEPMDGVVYGVALSLGFATLENVLYVSTGGLEVALTRALTAVPCHAFLGAIMGYFVGRAKFAESGRRAGTRCWWLYCRWRRWWSSDCGSGRSV
jgi:RsiW-degrading membrane proteinase PrsW (M82 family)